MSAGSEPELTEIVYTSYAHEPWAPEALTGLLEQARRANGEHGLTGVLLYGDAAFLQVLEGPSDAVFALLDKIRLDPRHHKLRVVIQRPITERRFGEWSMAFHAPLGWDGPEGFDDIEELGDRIDGPAKSLVSAFASLHR